MKSKCQLDFELWFGFDVGTDMDIQTEIAWDSWVRAWNAGGSAEREACAEICDRLTTAIDGGGNSYFRPATADQCARAIRGQSK